MGYRYHRSVKIGKHLRVNYSTHGKSLSFKGLGATYNIGKNGIRQTTTNPFTHVSYSRMLTQPKKHQSSSFSRSTTASKMQSAFPSHEATLKMDNNGHVTVVDDHGNVIKDQAIIRRVKSSSNYQAGVEQLEKERQRLISQAVRESEINDSKFIDIYKESAVVASRYAFEKQLKIMKPDEYHIPDYQISAPFADEVRKELEQEAIQNVKASIFKVKKLRKQYVEENLQDRLAEKTAEWKKDKDAYFAQ